MEVSIGTPSSPSPLAFLPPSHSTLLHTTWGLGNELQLCGITPNSASDQCDLATSSIVQWETLPHPHDKLAHESVLLFSKLKEELKSFPSRKDSSLAQYSCHILALLRGEVDNSTPQEGALWDLLDLLLFKRKQRAEVMLSEDLQRWLRRNRLPLLNDGPLSGGVQNELEQAAVPEAHAQFWQTIQYLVALGWLSEALELLSLHSAWLRWDGAADMNDPEVYALISVLEPVALLLEKFPVMNMAMNSGRECFSLSEYTIYHSSWKRQCVDLLNSRKLWSACHEVSPETSSSLQRIVAILTGNRDAVTSCAGCKWPGQLVSRLTHLYVGAKSKAELSQVLEECTNECGLGEDNFLPCLAKTLQSVCDGDFQPTLHAVSTFASSWFIAHIMPILSQISSNQTHSCSKGLLSHFGGDQEEFYLLEFVSGLMASSSTMPLARQYLTWCPTQGYAALDALLEHTSEAEKRATKS